MKPQLDIFIIVHLIIQINKTPIILFPKLVFVIYEELTRKITGCAMKAHSILGNGFQEVIYQRAMAIEMRKQGLNFAREMEMIIFYEGEDIGTRRVDFFVEEKIMVELKAIIALNDSNLN